MLDSHDALREQVISAKNYYEMYYDECGEHRQIANVVIRWARESRKYGLPIAVDVEMSAPHDQRLVAAVLALLNAIDDPEMYSFHNMSPTDENNAPLVLDALDGSALLRDAENLLQNASVYRAERAQRNPTREPKVRGWLGFMGCLRRR